MFYGGEKESSRHFQGRDVSKRKIIQKFTESSINKGFKDFLTKNFYFRNCPLKYPFYLF